MTPSILVLLTSVLASQIGPDCQALLDRLLLDTSSTWLAAGTITGLHVQYRSSRTEDQGNVAQLVDQAIKSYMADPAKPQTSSSMQQQMLEAIPFNVRYAWLNEYTCTTREQVVYDDQAYCWRIDVLARTDSIQPDKVLAANPMCDAFRLEWNQQRFFSWDGQAYTSYFLPVNKAVVDAAGRIDHPVNGPLTAGVLVWGQGLLSRQSLAQASCTAYEVQTDGQQAVRLIIQWPSGIRADLLLVPQMDYRPRSAVIEVPGRSITSITYQDYTSAGDRWIPRSIFIQQRDPLTGRLIGYDQWTIEQIDPTRPTLAQMKVGFRPNAYVQFVAPPSGLRLAYQYHPLVDTERVLGSTLQVLAERPGNCGLAALAYVADILGKRLPATRDLQGPISVQQILEMARKAGLHCRAVRMDPKALGSLTGCQAILYLPGRRHFVVLARAEGDGLWLVDPSSRLILYRVDLGSFEAEQWKDHLVILISNSQIDLAAQDLTGEQARSIHGAEGYACTEELQRFLIIYCDWVNYICLGQLWIYWDLYGCQEAPYGSCMYSLFEARCCSPCINKPTNPWECTITGEWTSYFAWACGTEPE